MLIHGERCFFQRFALPVPIKCTGRKNINTTTHSHGCGNRSLSHTSRRACHSRRRRRRVAIVQLYYSSVVRYTTGTVYYVMASSNADAFWHIHRVPDFQDQVLGCTAEIVGQGAAVRQAVLTRTGWKFNDGDLDFGNWQDFWWWPLELTLYFSFFF